MPTAPVPREADIQRSILAYLNLVGWAVKVPAGGARRGRHFVKLATAGTPDILGVVRGRMIGCEVKRPGGRLRSSQGVQLDAIRAAGGLAFVARSVGDVVDTLRAEGLL